DAVAPERLAASPAAHDRLGARDEVLRQSLLDALAETDWNISLAAARLGVARNTVYARLERFGLRAAAERKIGGDHPRGSEVALPRDAPPLAASESAPPVSHAALGWEQRSLALLRANVSVPDGADAWSRASRALDAIIAKVHGFGGRVEELTATSL